jgi:glycosyltransferase involved in cell wall biosynthesis
MPNYPKGKIYPGYGGFLRQEKQSGVNIIRTFIYPTQKTGFIPRMANYLSFAVSSAMLGSILAARCDYLLVESPPLFLGISGVYLSWLKRARLIFNVSDLWPESAVHLGVVRRDSSAFRLSAWLERFCYKKAWLVTGQSREILESITQRFPRCLTFHLSNGVNTRVFRPDAEPRDTRIRLNGKKQFVALYAGLHGLAQGLDQILDAASVLHAESKFWFAFVGDGPVKRVLMEKAREWGLTNVHFYDSRPGHEMPALLVAADVILVTLRMPIPGAVPSKLYEAMAAGRPVVLVANGEAAEIVRKHEAGVVVEPGDVASLVEALRSLCVRPELRRALGANGRAAAQRYFDRATISKAFVEHLEASL